MSGLHWEEFDRRRLASTEYKCPKCGADSSTIDVVGEQAWHKPSGVLHEHIQSLRARCCNGHEWMEIEP